ncbi:MAG: gliding motility-associated C-terminal domain-containing protein [Bacteroidia bacterium]|nr:gliding motility-associated C-terminal domain-containing protein [Bacteroidia bacterium]
MIKIFVFSVLLFIVIVTEIKSQTYNLNSSINNTTISGCNFTLYDSGGPVSSYQNSENYTVTFCSGNSDCLQLQFAGNFGLEQGFENLSIHDGNSTGANLLASLDGYILPTTYTTSGSCVTIHFTSDGSVTYEGFQINITCTGNCYVPPPPPTNDDPCTAFNITVNPTCNYTAYTCQNATGTTTVPAPTCASGYMGSDVWFSTVVASTGVIVQLGAGGMSDIGMAIYSGTSCSALTEILCNEPSAGLPPSQLVGSALAGQTIWIRVWQPYNSSPSSFNICAFEPAPPPPTNSGCPNANFAFQDFTNWQGFTGTYSACCPSTGIVNGRHTIMNAPGTDPNTGNALNILPPGLSVGARLGNESTGAQAERLRYTLTVNASNSMFFYRYAVVLEDPAHDLSDQPKFDIMILDANNNIVDPMCGMYSIISGGSIPGFQSFGTTRWKDWTVVGIDLSPYMGQNISIEYTTYDCLQTGHYGYAYLSCDCMPMGINVGFCVGNLDAELSAPPGFSYLWSPGGATSQSITINNPTIGTTYTCELTAPNGCQITLTSVLEQTYMTPGFSIDPVVCTYNVQLYDTSFVNQGTIGAWNWDFGDGTTSNLQNPLHTFPAPGTYTITLVVSSAAGGCTDTVSHQVTIFPAPIANAGPDVTACALEYTLQATPSTGVGTWTGSGPGLFSFIGGVNNTNSIVQVSTTGVYTFTWSVNDGGGCINSDNVIINFNEPPTANAGTDISTCQLGATLHGYTNVGTGSWSQVSGPATISFANSNSAITTFTSTTPGTYLIQWTANNGSCYDTDTVSVILIPPPYAFAGLDEVACGNSINLSADSTYPGWWTANSSNIVFSSSSSDPSPYVWTTTTTSSSFTVSLVWHVFDGQCYGTDTLSVTFVKLPHAEAGPTQSVCGVLTQLGADTIGSGMSSGHWTCNIPGLSIIPTGSGTVQWDPNVSAATLGSGFFNSNSQHPVWFYWNAYNGPVCYSVDSVLVTFYQKPAANAGVDTTVCGLSYNLGGDWSINNHSGIWSTLLPAPGIANFIPTTAPDGDVTVTNYGIYDFIWKEMNQGNTVCYDRDTVRVEFKVIPMPDAGLDFSVCGLWAIISATPSVSGGYWSNTSGVAFYDVINGTYTPSNAYLPTTPIRYGSENEMITMYWFETLNGCTEYDSVNVYFGSIQDAVHLVDPADSTVCGPMYTLLNAQQPAYGSGYWIDDIFSTTFTPSPVSPSPIASIDTGSVDYYGYHNFYWVTVNGDCRDTSDAVPVKFIQQPVANAGPHYWPGLFGNNHQIKTDTVCGLNYQMAAVPSIGIGDWTSEDINVHFGGLQGPPNTPVYNDSLYMSGVGNYSVFNITGDRYKEFVWQEHNEGCTDSDTLRLYFAPYPSGTFSTTMPACRHDSSMIIATTWPLPGHIDYMITNYEWSYPNGNLSPVIINTTVSDTIYVSWPTGEQHNVTLITTNTWGCRSGIVTHQVIEPAPFNPSYDLTDAHCMDCNGEILLSTANGTHSNYYTFNWIDTSFVNPSALLQTQLCPLTSYGVIVNGESLSDDATPGTVCHDTISIFVADTGKVTAQFETMLLEQHQAVPYNVQFINTSIGGRRYSWRVYDEAGTLVYTSTQEAPNYIFAEEGCFQIVLVAESKWGCKDTMEFNPLCVDAYPVMEVPNSFTPNNDGQNDIFQVHSKSIETFHAVILNRWGKKLYEWDNAEGGWDGKIGKSEASPGVYYYIITAKGKKDVDFEFKGFFYLLKEK